MKNLFLLLAILATQASAAPLEKILLSCVRGGPNLGAPVYALVELETPGSPMKYYLKMSPLNPTVQPIYLEVPRPLHYGNTWIATRDMGRSGYAHLFSHGSLAIVDIDLFQALERSMNTNGALKDYSCSSSG